MITTINEYKEHLQSQFKVTAPFIKGNYKIVLNGSNTRIGTNRFDVGDIITIDSQHGSLGTIINLYNKTKKEKTTYWSRGYGDSDLLNNVEKIIEKEPEPEPVKKDDSHPNNINNLWKNIKVNNIDVVFALYEFFSDFVNPLVDGGLDGLPYEILLEDNKLIFNMFDDERNNVLWTKTIDISDIIDDKQKVMDRVEQILLDNYEKNK